MSVVTEKRDPVGGILPESASFSGRAFRSQMAVTGPEPTGVGLRKNPLSREQPPTPLVRAVEKPHIRALQAEGL